MRKLWSVAVLVVAVSSLAAAEDLGKKLTGTWKIDAEATVSMAVKKGTFKVPEGMTLADAGANYAGMGLAITSSAFNLTYMDTSDPKAPTSYRLLKTEGQRLSLEVTATVEGKKTTAPMLVEFLDPDTINVSETPDPSDGMIFKRVK